MSQPETQPEIDLIHHRNRSSTTKFGDFHHGTSRLLSRLETKLTFPSPTTTTTGARGPRFHTNRTRGFDIPETSSLAKPNGRSTSCAFAFHTPTTTTSIRKDDKPTVCCYRRQWNPCHMDSWSCSSKPLTGRTGHKLKDASTTGTTGDTPWIQDYSHYRTRTRLMTTCLVGTPLH